MQKRIIFSDNGTLQDLSTNVVDFHGDDSNLNIVTAEDALYVASALPFNHFYLKLGSTLNALSCALTVKLYNGSQWVDVVNTIDETSVAGATMAQSGFLTWTPDKEETWSIESDSRDIAELSGIAIYDMCWLKIEFSNDIEFDLSWLGQLFSNDSDLADEFPDITSSNFKASLGLSTYIAQSKVSADVIIKDLKDKNLIVDGSQVIYRDDLRLASVYKVAEIVFNMLGDDYLENKVKARQEYKDRLKKARVLVDRNQDGIASISERNLQVRRLKR